jgi:hypothetical protein
MTPTPPINTRTDNRHSARLSAGSAHARIGVLDSPPVARAISSRDAQMPRSHPRTRPSLAANRSPQPRQSKLLTPQPAAKSP